MDYNKTIAKARAKAQAALVNRHKEEYQQLIAIEHQKHGLIAKYRTTEQQIAWHRDKIAELENRIDNNKTASL